MSYKRELLWILCTIITILIICFGRTPHILKTIIYVLIALLVIITFIFIIVAIRSSGDIIIYQCPKCNTEYRDNRLVCPECKVELKQIKKL